MPTYEYICDACDHEFEKFQPMSADPVKKCPACGKNKARRLISSGAGLIFKGSGFYITDYRDNGYKEKAKAESDAGSSTSEGKSGGEGKSAEGKSGESKSTETTAAAKTESAPAATATKPESKGSNGASKKKSK